MMLASALCSRRGMATITKNMLGHKFINGQAKSQLLKLHRAGVEALRAQPRGDGTPRWLRPQLSKRRQAVLRHKALENGTYGTFSMQEGGWLKEWDALPNATQMLRPYKLKKRDRTRDDRAAKIDKAMAEMPAKIEAYKKARKASKPKKDIESRLKRMFARANRS